MVPLKREKHFLYWVLLTVFSLIALTSFTNNREDDWNREQRWVISVAAVSLALSAIGAGASLFMAGGFVTTSIELVLVLIILAFWCAGLPAILDPSHRFAQAGEAYSTLYIFTIWNANLFFFSWASFFIALKLLGLHLARLMKRQDDRFLSSWLFFTAASFVTMASAAHIWRDGGCNSFDVNMCSRTIFAVILGAISGLLGLILFLVPIVAVHQIASIILLAAWCFEISYITYDDGPSTLMNTLYFSSWAAFITALCIGALSFFTLVEKALGRSPEETTAGQVHGEHGEHREVHTKHVDIKNDPEDREAEEIAAPMAP